MVALACAEQLGPTTAPDEDEDDRFDPMAEPVEDGDTGKGSNNRFVDNDDVLTEPQVCKLLPAGDGACAHACDPVALATFIPEGTCATFTCTLTDGSEFRAGGCNTAD